MMPNQDKTNEELLKELQTLQQEFNSLKASYDKDITEHKLADDSLWKSGSFFEAVFNNLNDALCGIDPTDFTIMMANEPFINMYKREKKEVIGKCCYEVTHNRTTPCSAPNDICPLAETLKTGKHSSAEHIHYDSCGTASYVDVSTAPIKNENGEIVQIIHRAQDITSRKLAEFDAIKSNNKAEEKESSLLYAQKIAKMGDWELDLINQKTRWSENCFILFGLKPFELEPTYEYFKSRIHPDDLFLLDEALEYLIREKCSTQIEIRVIFPDGSFKWFQNDIVPFFEGDKLVKLKGTNIDITVRKIAEIKLINALEKATESDRLKSAFLTNMSHEIRTPMNGILGFSNLLKEPNLTGEKQQQYIEIIQKSGARMLNTINDIIDISKIESGQMNVSISEVNVNEQMRFFCDFFKPEVENKGLLPICEYTLPGNEATILTDREKVYAILTNLVKNAIKFTQKGSVEFGCVRKGEFLEFFVKDTGIGIPKDRQEAIFERFVQADIADAMALKGSGLGLSISKAYVEMLGGKIWVESEEGKGSVFYFTLPYNVKPDEKIITENVVLSEDKAVPRNNLKILIADDEITSEMLLTELVGKYSKELLYAKNGVEAVEACRNNPDIDLVLMDAKMPQMDGYEATRQIRQFNKDVVIIAQTAFALGGDKENALKAGCNDYIPKPINRDLLTLLLKKYFP